MIKKIFLLLIICLQSGAILSQDLSKVKWGFGISSKFYSDFSAENAVQVNSFFSFPFFVSTKIKIEPFIGYSNTDSKGKTTIYVQNNASSYNDIYYNQKNFIIGSGFFYSKVVKNVTFHFGSNFGYIIYKQNLKDDYAYYYAEDNIKGKGFIIAPTIGGEYFLEEYISLGIEARFEWLSLKTDGKRTFPGVNDLKHIINNSVTNYYTQGFIIIRIYPFSI